MERIWSSGAHVRCIHPGWDVLEGWLDVRRSWQMIFAADDHVEIELGRVQVRADGSTGWVTCIERIVAVSAVGPMVDEILATNVFELDPRTQQWLMVQHHASPILHRASSTFTSPSPRSELN